MFLIVFEEIKTKNNEIDLINQNENEETAIIIGKKNHNFNERKIKKIKKKRKEI